MVAFFETLLQKVPLCKEAKSRTFQFVIKIASKEALYVAIFETHRRKVHIK